MKTYKGILDLYSEQGVGPEAILFSPEPAHVSVWDRMFWFKKGQQYAVKIFDRTNKLIYDGTWTYSRKHSSINRFSSPLEINPQDWKEMIYQKMNIELKDITMIEIPEDGIITSYLDLDLYKLTMAQFAYHWKNKTLMGQNAKYKLFIRSQHDLSNLKSEIEKQIKYLKVLQFNDDELEYLQSIKIKGQQLFKDDFLQYLKYFNIKSTFFTIKTEDNLEIEYSSSWEESILLETILMSIISELHFKNNYSKEDGLEELNNKIEYYKINKCEFKFADMGTRRRLSKDWHEEVLVKLKEELPEALLGTSNVLLAKKLNLTPIGTMAHEYFQAFQVLGTSFETSQKEALYAWYHEYGDLLNVALTDILGTDVFLHDCDQDLTEKYDGFRHDSGDPIIWGYKMLAHFSEMGVKDKYLLFSDGLNFAKSHKIKNEFKDKIKTVFGIGTFLTNDFKNHKALQIVIKMVEMNKKPTIKVSDEPEKVTCINQELITKTYEYISKVKKYPRINTCVDAVIFNTENEVLLIKRGDKNSAEYNKWSLVGGYVDYFETTKDAIIREIREELGVSKVDVHNMLTVADDPLRDPKGRNISIIYKVTISNDIKFNKNEVKGYKWFNLNKLPQDMAFDHKKIIETLDN